MTIISHDEIRAKVMHLWEAGGLPKGSSTGWPSVDSLYTVGMSQWTLVTGTPNSGKSEWVDALMVNLAKREPWRFYIFSPENWPLELHHAKILEKYTGKPFNPGPTQRMDEDEVEAGEEWMRDKFFFCKPLDSNIVSIIGEAGEEAFAANFKGKIGLVVDPWNQLEHHRPAGMSETEYVSQTLTYVIELVRLTNMHLWLVAHPSKLQKTKEGKLPVPTPHDVSGSAHFWNKSDNCITVWRDLAAGTQEVEIHVQKVRFKHIGRIGLTTLLYDRVTGQYREQPLKAVDYRRGTDGE